MDSVEKTIRKLKRDSMLSENNIVEETAVDWRGRPCKPDKHGGMSAAAFVLGIFLLFLF